MRVTLVRGDEQLPLGMVDGGTRCDLGFVDDLVRLQLTARRRGWSVRLDEVREDFLEILVLVGLAEALVLEPGRKAEGGEEGGIDEVVDPRDPPA